MRRYRALQRVGSVIVQVQPVGGDIPVRFLRNMVPHVPVDDDLLHARLGAGPRRRQGALVISRFLFTLALALWYLILEPLGHFGITNIDPGRQTIIYVVQPAQAGLYGRVPEFYGTKVR